MTLSREVWNETAYSPNDLNSRDAQTLLVFVPGGLTRAITTEVQEVPLLFGVQEEIIIIGNIKNITIMMWYRMQKNKVKAYKKYYSTF